jgi:general secretion pathway protein J
MRGFTLVEMMVALLIFGMLAAAGVMVMRSSVDSQMAVRSSVDRIGAFQRLRATLKADLAQAAPRRTRGPDGEPQPPFAGGVGGGALLTLVRRGWENPDGRPRASLQYVEYRLVEDQLERRVRSGLDGGVLGEPQVLAEGVEGLQIAFLADQEWRPSWGEAGDLPEAVRLDLTITGLGQTTQLFLTPAGAR